MPRVATPVEAPPEVASETEIPAEAETPAVADPKLQAALDKVAEHADAAVEIMPPEHAPQDTRPKRNPSPSAPPQNEAVNASQLRWEATFAPEGKATDDGRMFWPGSISWRQLPLSLMAMIETSEGGHVGAELAGRIDEVFREGDLIRARGVFDSGEYGSEIARLVGDGTLRGLSVDIAAREYEFIARDKLFNADGELNRDALDQPDDEEVDLLDILFGGEDMVFVVTDGVIGAATVCPFPAFEDAQISLAAGGHIWSLKLQGGFTVTREPLPEAEGEPQEQLTAAAAGLAPVHPPAEWFANPELEELTPLTVSSDGRIFGHAAAWNTCHIGIQDSCTTAPHSQTNYAYFLLGEVETADGDSLSVGKITLGTGHADRRLGRQATAEHYDNTGTAVADIACGEDEHGIWFAGALRPDVDAERIREFRASVLSGDWRNVNGNLELVGLLAVNVPGFPVPRPRALMAAGDDGAKVLALTAAGIHDGRTRDDLTPEDLARLAALRARATGGIQALAALARREAA